MQAIYNDKVIAEADKDDLIFIEGNWYFPPDSLKKDYFKPSDQHTTCFWKGEANYYNVEVDGDEADGAAFYYPEPMKSGIDKVKKDFTNYVSFWRGVDVK